MKFTEWRNQVEGLKDYSEAKKDLDLNFKLANAVLDARIKKGWSQDQLAKAIGTKQANISRIESGLANPTLEFINRLVSVLDFDIEFSCEKEKIVQFVNEPKRETFRANYAMAISIDIPAFDFSSSQSETRETKVFA